MTKKRKVIQIAVSATPNDLFLYALADDGSLWIRAAIPTAIPAAGGALWKFRRGQNENETFTFG
jgi:hypothetical protein